MACTENGWREMESERQTVYLLRSDDEAPSSGGDGPSGRASTRGCHCEGLEFDAAAFEDFAWCWSGIERKRFASFEMFSGSVCGIGSTRYDGH